MKTIISSNWIDPPKRERKKNYNETDYYRNAMAQAARPAKASGPKIAKLQQMSDFQFYNTARIQEIYDKDVRRKTYEWNKDRKKEENAAKDEENAAVDAEEEDPNAPPAITDEEKAEMETLLSQGFTEWSRRDFQAFCRLSEKYGRDAIESVASEMEGKTPKEVKDYAAVFWQRYEEIADHQRIISNIEKGEQKIQRQHDMLKAVRQKIAMYKNPWRELKLSYGPNKFKSFTEEEDRFLLCSIPEVGFGNWDELKAQIRQHWQFRFDWFIKSRTPKELGRRVETLISLIEKESEAGDKKREAGEADEAGGAKKAKVEEEEDEE